MNCPKCGIEVTPGTKFCSNCGAPIPVTKEQQTATGTPSQQVSRTAQPEKRILEIPVEYKPISAWGYFGYNLLFKIPIVGLVFMIVFALGGTKNKNLRNYARSQFIWLLLVIILAVIIAILYFLGAGTR